MKKTKTTPAAFKPSPRIPREPSPLFATAVLRTVKPPAQIARVDQPVLPSEAELGQQRAERVPSMNDADLGIQTGTSPSNPVNMTAVPRTVKLPAQIPRVDQPVLPTEAALGQQCAERVPSMTDADLGIRMGTSPSRNSFDIPSERIPVVGMAGTSKELPSAFKSSHRIPRERSPELVQVVAQPVRSPEVLYRQTADVSPQSEFVLGQRGDLVPSMTDFDLSAEVGRPLTQIFCTEVGSPLTQTAEVDSPLTQTAFQIQGGCRVESKRDVVTLASSVFRSSGRLARERSPVLASARPKAASPYAQSVAQLSAESPLVDDELMQDIAPVLASARPNAARPSAQPVAQFFAESPLDDVLMRDMPPVLASPRPKAARPCAQPVAQLSAESSLVDDELMQTVGAGSSLSEQNGGIEVAASLARSGEVPDRVEPRADSQQQMAAMNLFRLFCCGGRDAGEWTADEMRLVDTHVVPELFGRHARISWSTPRIALDELQRLIFDNPMPAHVWHALDNAETHPIRGGPHGSAADSMQQRPSVRAAKAQPRLGIARSGSSVSTGVKMLQRLGSSDGLTPKASRSPCTRTRPS